MVSKTVFCVQAYLSGLSKTVFCVQAFLSGV